jgi:hypothetical protein
MAFRDTIENFVTRIQPLRPLVLPILLAIVLVAFAPARIAAALLGVLLAISLCNSFLPRVRPAAQIAILWVAITATADAAYAKLNDQAPLTIVNAFAKIVDAIMKLVFPLLREMGLPVGDPRYTVVAVAPDFIWAVVLSLAVLMSLAHAFPARDRSDISRGASRPRAVA